MGDDRLAVAAEAVHRHAFREAISILRPMAETGDCNAQFALGFLVLTECEDLTGREGFQWLKAAAEQGHPQAAYHVATFPTFVREGFASSLTPDENRRLLLQAAQGGSVDAQYLVAARLASGDWEGEAKEPEPGEALVWYRLAAEAGHLEAQFNFGCMLLEGEGCVPDRSKGILWLKRAAASGDDQAMRYLEHLGETNPE